MIPTTLIAIVFGRRIMRPLQVLTEASKRLSRGEQVIIPPAAGPNGVQEITTAFNEMQKSLIRFVNGRTQMLAAMGHDLRTPLTSLRIRAEMVEDEGLRTAMVQTLDDMKVIVDETLQFARDDARQEQTLAVWLNDLVDEVVCEQRMQGREVDFKTQVAHEDSLFRCRPVHLKRALNNLIDNGARYGVVHVALRFDADRHQYLIEVTDSGPGIEEDQLEHVFEPFVRLDSSRSRATGGAGLGLAIARSCSRAHGGDVTLSNRPQGGLSALIQLPA
ncbi:ATP-binding protein [Achromobacter aloeverae]